MIAISRHPQITPDRYYRENVYFI